MSKLMRKVGLSDEIKMPEQSTAPTMDQKNVKDEQRKKVAAAARRGGRTSTILSDETRLGG